MPAGAAPTDILDEMSAPYRAATMLQSLVGRIPGPDVVPLSGFVDFTRQFKEAIAPTVAGMHSIPMLLDEVLHPLSTMTAAVLRDVEWLPPGPVGFDVEPVPPVSVPMSLEVREYLCRVVAWYVSPPLHGLAGPHRPQREDRRGLADTLAEILRHLEPARRLRTAAHIPPGVAPTHPGHPRRDRCLNTHQPTEAIASLEA